MALGPTAKESQEEKGRGKERGERRRRKRRVKEERGEQGGRREEEERQQGEGCTQERQDSRRQSGAPICRRFLQSSPHERLCYLLGPQEGQKGGAN
jgi:hypothetical protein